MLRVGLVRVWRAGPGSRSLRNRLNASSQAKGICWIFARQQIPSYLSHVGCGSDLLSLMGYVPFAEVSSGPLGFPRDQRTLGNSASVEGVMIVHGKGSRKAAKDLPVAYDLDQQVCTFTDFHRLLANSHPIICQDNCVTLLGSLSSQRLERYLALISFVRTLRGRRS